MGLSCKISMKPIHWIIQFNRIFHDFPLTIQLWGYLHLWKPPCIPIIVNGKCTSQPCSTTEVTALLAPSDWHHGILDRIKVMGVVASSLPSWHWAKTLNSGWWFGTWMDYCFHSVGNNPSHWLIFFRGVETTNQNLVSYDNKFIRGDNQHHHGIMTNNNNNNKMKQPM